MGAQETGRERTYRYNRMPEKSSGGAHRRWLHSATSNLPPLMEVGGTVEANSTFKTGRALALPPSAGPRSIFRTQDKTLEGAPLTIVAHHLPS